MKYQFFLYIQLEIFVQRCICFGGFNVDIRHHQGGYQVEVQRVKKHQVLIIKKYFQEATGHQLESA